MKRERQNISYATDFEDNNNDSIRNLDYYSGNFFSLKMYWLNQLSGDLPETNLIPDYIRSVSSSREKQTVSFELSKELSKTIIRLAKGSYLSIYLLLLSAIGLLLQKYTDNHDVIVGSPIYKIGDRERCSNTVIPLRFNVENQLTFKDFLHHVKNTVIDAYIYQDYPFSQLMQSLKLTQTENFNSIFNVIVLLENIHNQKDISDLNNDLTFAFVVKGSQIQCSINYKNSIFRDETIQVLTKYYINLLEEIPSHIDSKLSDINLLRETDRQQLLTVFNNQDKDYPVDQTLQALFEKQVTRTPHQTAAVFKGTKLTYKELNEKANQLARFLQGLGVRQGDFVGILKDRDIDFLIAILGILKIGGVYVPIDGSYPLERIKYMLSDSEIRVLLTASNFIQPLNDIIEYCSCLKDLICLDRQPLSKDSEIADLANIHLHNTFRFDQIPKDNLGLFSQGSDLAYMIYTSGSTGTPKGTLVRQGGAINHIFAQFDALEFTQNDRFLQSAPASSDISVWQFLAPLLIGGRTVIADAETVSDPETLFKIIQHENLTIVELVPVVLAGLLDYSARLSPQQRVLPELKWMMATGESVSVELVNRWFSLYPTIRLVNAYGPTEAADDITQLIIEQPLAIMNGRFPLAAP